MTGCGKIPFGSQMLAANLGRAAGDVLARRHRPGGVPVPGVRAGDMARDQPWESGEGGVNRAAELATLQVRQQAEKIMATLPPEEEWATEQRRRDLANDAARLSRKQRRARKLRGTA